MAIILNQEEYDILIGAILGDAHLRKLKQDVRVEIVHSIKQQEYLFWKYQKLKRWCQTEPHLVKFKDARSGKKYLQWRFQTLSNKIFTDLWRMFYKNGTKIVPKNIVEILKSPLSLAVWFMDDGGRRNDSYGLFLNTLSFSKLEQKRLSECLKKNFKINSRIHWITDGYRLYIPSSEAKRFCTIIHPYIINELQYKLPYNPVTTSFARLNRARDRNF
jgi:hypothetical protein